MEAYYRGERIAFAEILGTRQKIANVLPPAACAVVTRKAGKDHPWRQSYKGMRPHTPHPVTNPLVGARTYAAP